MAHRKIQVHKINRDARNVRVVKPKRIIQIAKKPQGKSVHQKKSVEPPKPKVRFQKKQNVEAVRHKGQGHLIRHRNKVVKDANYKKIMEIKGVGRGRVLVMIACGPSVLEVDFTPFKDHNEIDIMVINKPLPQIWPSTYWAFCDHSQYERNRDAFKNYTGILINSTAVRTNRANQIKINAKHTTGVSRHLPEGYVIGRSSVYANIQTALWMDYKKIFIFGVDMCKVGDKLHHYGVNPDVPQNKRMERFRIEAKNYDMMASALPEELRQKIYFCSSHNPWEFTKRFNRWDHKGAIPKILNIAKSISEECKTSKESPAT